MQVYDLAWSPTGEYIIAGSTDNCARIFTASEGEWSSRLFQDPLVLWVWHRVSRGGHIMCSVLFAPVLRPVARAKVSVSVGIISAIEADGDSAVSCDAAASNSSYRTSAATAGTGWFRCCCMARSRSFGIVMRSI